MGVLFVVYSCDHCHVCVFMLKHSQRYTYKERVAQTPYILGLVPRFLYLHSIEIVLIGGFLQLGILDLKL